VLVDDWSNSMSVRRDTRNGRWLYRKTIRLADGRRVRISGVPTSVGLPNTRVGADEAERQHITRALTTGEVSQTPPPPKEIPTINEFVTTYLDTARIGNKASSVDAKESLLRVHLLPRLGKLRLDQVTYAVIEDMKVNLAKTPVAHGERQGAPAGAQFRTLSFKTINNCLTCLRRMLSIARKRGIIEHIPEVDWLRPPKPDFDFLTFEEANRLLAAATGEERTMMLVGLRTGLRFGEMLGLRWQDVDLVAGRLMVRQNIVKGRVGTPKSGHAREVPLGGDVRAALKRHRHLRGPLVFCDDGGHVLTVGEPRWWLERACRKAGLRQIGWHCLRHTFASHLAMRGAPLKAIQELLGHSTIQMTMRYAHLAPEVARDAVRLLDGGSTTWRGSSVAAEAES
jgi:integrase